MGANSCFSTSYQPIPRFIRFPRGIQLNVSVTGNTAHLTIYLFSSIDDRHRYKNCKSGYLVLDTMYLLLLLFICFLIIFCHICYYYYFDITQADHVFVMKNGRVTSEGTYEELARSDKYFASIVETQEVADHDNTHEDTIIHETTPSSDIVEGNGLEMAKEDKLTGNVSCRTYYNYIRAGSSYFVLLLMAVFTFLPDGKYSSSALLNVFHITPLYMY